MLRRFEYTQARSVEEALALWQGSPDSRYLAGGTDLIPRARATGRAPARLVDVKAVPELDQVRALPDGGLSIGAAASVARVATAPEVRQRFPVLATCCQALGSYPLRQRATVAGNICNASPCADTAAALLDLDAVVVASGPRGVRRVSIHELFVGPGQTSLERGELVTAIELPAASAGARGQLGRLTRRQGVDIATVAVLVTVLPAGSLRHRVALLSVSPTPMRVAEAENLLDQKGPDGAAEAAAIARAACRPIDDVRGSASYRRDMVGVLLERAVHALAAERGGRGA
ncbi:MAG TPA: xanthine dehydrogenase family protein subunit M [Myxococcota bacterium]|nr:xanthine dehydrogenase family protein subunit M [Myxococcota bacterium]HRY97323.1 xanthine dehydrogenase family protein subunit M [Myxococcota bacterium]HSA22455.1 xanthine dehydrogenase family protein subunit M [Myxococcota bacterium]